MIFVKLSWLPYILIAGGIFGLIDGNAAGLIPIAIGAAWLVLKYKNKNSGSSSSRSSAGSSAGSTEQKTFVAAPSSQVETKSKPVLDSKEKKVFIATPLPQVEPLPKPVSDSKEKKVFIATPIPQVESQPKPVSGSKERKVFVATPIPKPEPEISNADDFEIVGEVVATPPLEAAKQEPEKPAGRVCPHCGAKTEPDDRYCIECGEEL